MNNLSGLGCPDLLFDNSKFETIGEMICPKCGNTHDCRILKIKSMTQKWHWCEICHHRWRNNLVSSGDNDK
jgi:hypothetical protein